MARLAATGDLVDSRSLQRMEISTAMTAADALIDFYRRFRQLVREQRPEEVALLHTRKYQNWTYSDAFKRASMESAIMIGTRAEDAIYRLVSQERVAKYLGLPARTWNAASLTASARALVDSVPSYWNDRALAFAAALTAASFAAEA